MVEMLRNSRISRPEIMLNPATMVIRTRIITTFRSIRSSHEKIEGYLFWAEEASGASSSCGVDSRTRVPTRLVMSSRAALLLSVREYSTAETSSEDQPLSRCMSDRPAKTTRFSSPDRMLG